jgi:hypothetical protein
MTDEEREATLTLLELANAGIKALVGKLGGSATLTSAEIQRALTTQVLITETLDGTTRFSVRDRG